MTKVVKFDLAICFRLFFWCKGWKRFSPIQPVFFSEKDNKLSSSTLRVDFLWRWWVQSTGDGSEIWLQLRFGSLSHYFQGFMHPRWLAGFLNHENSMSGFASKNKGYAGRIEGSEGCKIGFQHGRGGNAFQFSQEIWWLRILLNRFVIHDQHHHTSSSASSSSLSSSSSSSSSSIYIYIHTHIYISIYHHPSSHLSGPSQKAALRRELRFRRLVTRPTRLGILSITQWKGLGFWRAPI